MLLSFYWSIVIFQIYICVDILSANVYHVKLYGVFAGFTALFIQTKIKASSFCRIVMVF